MTVEKRKRTENTGKGWSMIGCCLNGSVLWVAVVRMLVVMD
jgi:hypothetical protein